MHGPVFREPNRSIGKTKWVATVHGYAAEGRTKRAAQKKLRQAVPQNLPVQWVQETSPFFER